MTKFDKKLLPSRHVTEGPERAPHRSYLYAMGLSEEEIHRPLVGVATCWNEAAPCNIALNRQAQAVKLGVKAAAGTPREFTTITVTDGIAMGHALEIATAHRGKGLGKWMMRCASFWAAENGADYMTALCTDANAAANGLYASLGMQAVGQYHYRMLPNSEGD